MPSDRAAVYHSFRRWSPYGCDENGPVRTIDKSLAEYLEAPVWTSRTDAFGRGAGAD